MGVLQLNKYEDHYLRLKKIFERVLGLIDQYHPDELAIEAPFYGKNVQSMLKLGRAQGVAMSAALARDIPINHENLWNDLFYWGERVRRRWAAHYWPHEEGKKNSGDDGDE